MLQRVAAHQTLAPDHPRFGDHVSYMGVYAGLIVDVDEDGRDCIVASYEDRTGYLETPYALVTLKRVEPRP